jgi:hypothetical protein
MLEKSLTSWCEPHLPRTSLKKLNAKSTFQDLNPQGERWLRELEARSRPAEMT